MMASDGKPLTEKEEEFYAKIRIDLSRRFASKPFDRSTRKGRRREKRYWRKKRDLGSGF